MIELQSQHKQGACPMKGSAHRPISRSAGDHSVAHPQTPERRRWRTPRLATLALLLPFALGSTAQTPLRWTPQASSPVTTVVTPSEARPASQPKPSPDIAYVPPPRHVMPLAGGFDVHQFETTAEALVAGERVPGMAMAIVRDGRILSLRGYGVTDVDAPQPVDTHTVFRLASLSKAFAGTLTGMLVSQGALRWDSHVTDYMPGLQFSQPGAAQQLTVADVVSQRAGLVHNTYDRDLEANVDYRSLVQKLAYAPMSCMPGQCYGYQNIAFSLIGDVVFAVTGKFYQDAVAQQIFKPLGMNDASYGLEGIEASPRWARPHVRGRGGWVALTPKPSYYRVAPAAGVNASISDMAQWLVAQTGHRPDVLPESLLATLHAPVVDTPGETHGSSWRRGRLNAAGYGIGWRVYDYAGHRVVFHGGAVQGYRAVIAMVPERDFGVVILWNSESVLPSGLLPTILDSAIGLPAGDWLDDETESRTLYAIQSRSQSENGDDAGSDASTSDAMPK
jgi:beta-lactamase class C